MTKKKNHSFSIEMDSKQNLSHVSLSDKADGVLIRGNLGELVSIALPECVMLEVKGSNGVLRIDLGYNELRKVVEKTGKNGGDNTV